MIASLDQLSPAARAAADAWVGASVAVVDAPLRAGVRDELTIALCEALDADATPDDVVTVVERIGPLDGDADNPTDGAPLDDPRVGRFLGIPYDWRPPSAERVHASLWSPADPALLRPRSFGAGWDLNFGALFVRLGLIEPDAEDEPFATTPHDAFVVAAGFPALMAAAVLAHYVARGRSLPARLPSHWDAAGHPDRWVTRRAAAATDIGLSVGAAALAASSAASRTNGAVRAARMAVAAAVAGGVAKTTVVRPMRGGWWVGPVLVGGVLGSAGLTLYGLALAGRNAERRRDLGRA